MADAQDGQFADFSFVDELPHGVVIPRVAQVEVDAADQSAGFRHVHHLPFFLYRVGYRFFGQNMFPVSNRLFDLFFPRVCQGEKSYKLGLATKAGKIASGEFSTERAVKTGKAYLVIVSEEASDNTRKMFANMCTYYRVPICYFGGKDELGHSMGKELRASLAVLDEGFAKALVKQMNWNGGSKYES